MPNPALILTKLGKGVEAFDDLLEDSRLKAALNNRRAGTLSQKWVLDQNGCPVRMFKTIEKMFDQWDVYQIMGDMLTYSFYGYHVTEIIWGTDGNLVLPVNVIGKAQRWFYYDDLNTLRYRTKVNMTLGEPVPPRKFIVCRLHPRYDDPYSGHESLAVACYWPIHFRRLLLQLAMNFSERYGSPWLDVEMEDVLQPERLQEILNVLQNTFNDGIVAHPSNTKVQALAMGEHKSMENYTMLLDWLNREIDMAVLGNNLTSEVREGSFAAARSHMDIRQDVVLEDCRTIESAFNQLIQWICWYNFPANVDMPKFRLYENAPATKERAEIDVMLAKLGVEFSKGYFERSYGIDDQEFELGPQQPDLSTGIKGRPVAGAVEATPEEGVEVGAENSDKIVKAGIESKDQGSNVVTKQAVQSAQRSGYPV